MSLYEGADAALCKQIDDRDAVAGAYLLHPLYIVLLQKIAGVVLTGVGVVLGRVDEVVLRGRNDDQVLCGIHLQQTSQHDIQGT